MCPSTHCTTASSRKPPRAGAAPKPPKGSRAFVRSARRNGTRRSEHRSAGLWPARRRDEFSSSDRRGGFFVDAAQQPPIAEQIARADFAHAQLAVAQEGIEPEVGVKA